MIYIIKTNLDLKSYYVEHLLKKFEDERYFFVTIKNSLDYKIFEAELKIIADKQKIQYKLEVIEKFDSHKNNKILAISGFKMDIKNQIFNILTTYTSMAVIKVLDQRTNKCELRLADNVIGCDVTDISSIYCAGCMATELDDNIFLWTNKHMIYNNDIVKVESIQLLNHIYNFHYDKIKLSYSDLDKVIENYSYSFGDGCYLSFHLFDDNSINFENIDSLMDITFQKDSELIKNIQNFINNTFNVLKNIYINNIKVKIEELQSVINKVKELKLCQNKLI